jgi:hypothetical protein
MPTTQEASSSLSASEYTEEQIVNAMIHVLENYSVKGHKKAVMQHMLSSMYALSKG